MEEELNQTPETNPVETGSTPAPAAPTTQKTGQTPKLQSTVDLIKSAFVVLQKDWLNYLIISALVLVIEDIFKFVVYGQSVLLSSTVTTSTTPMLVSWPVYFVLLVVEFVLVSFLGLTLLRSVYSAAEGQSESIGNSMQYALTNYLPYVGITIVMGFGILLGVILLIIPGIILALMWALVPAVFVLEGKHGLEVFTRSKELTKGYKWAILGRVLLYALLAFVVLFLASIVFGLVGMTLAFSVWLQFFYFTIYGLAITVVVGILGASIVYYIYKDLVAIKG
jgi:hypothetical protein